MNKSLKKQYSAAEDMLTAFLITYAFAACSVSGSNAVHSAIFFALSMAVWLWFLFRGGRAASPAFPVFTLALWVLPEALGNLADMIFGRLEITGRITGIFTVLTEMPCAAAGKFLRIPLAAAEAVILLIFGATYILGVTAYLNDEIKRRRRYC